MHRKTRAPRSRILGTGRYVPGKVVTNAEIEEIWAVTPIGTKVEVLP